MTNPSPSKNAFAAAEFRRGLAVLDLNHAQAARCLGIDHRTIRRYTGETSTATAIPAPVSAWLDLVLWLHRHEHHAALAHALGPKDRRETGT